MAAETLTESHLHKDAEKLDGLDWCLGEGTPEYRCLGSSTVIVLFYAVGCIIFGFLVGVTVMMIDKRRQRAAANNSNHEEIVNAEGKRLRTFSEKSQMSELSQALDMAVKEGKFPGNRDEFRQFHRTDSSGSAPPSRKTSVIQRPPTDSP